MQRSDIDLNLDCNYGSCRCE